MDTHVEKNVLIDASKIITEACVRSGADIYVGYPITPSNWFYAYARKRFPVFYAGPDEITVLQWMSGFATTGHFPVTATSFPGLALMIETLNMAYMMELPMLIILTQRLGPSTGSATTGAQGDLPLLKGCISGGYPLPVFCPSDFEDAWTLTNEAIRTAIELRTPVVLMTSKEMVMTQRSFDTGKLPPLHKIDRPKPELKPDHLSYQLKDGLVPPFMPVGNDELQVRINSSTHNNEGLIRKGSREALANTQRLKAKVEYYAPNIAFFDYHKVDKAKEIILSYGISSEAARDAAEKLNDEDYRISLLILKTLIPVPVDVYGILDTYQRIVIVEENISGSLREHLYGGAPNDKIINVNNIGSMIKPADIIKSITNDQ